MKNTDWREYRNLRPIVHTKPEGKMSEYRYKDRSDAERLLMEQLEALAKAKAEMERGAQVEEQGQRVKQAASATVRICRDALEALVSEMMDRGDLPTYSDAQLNDMRYTIADDSLPVVRPDENGSLEVVHDPYIQQPWCEDIDPASAENATKEVLDNGN